MAGRASKAPLFSITFIVDGVGALRDRAVGARIDLLRNGDYGVYVRRVFPSRLLAGLPESVCRLRLARHPNLTPLLRSAESR